MFHECCWNQGLLEPRLRNVRDRAASLNLVSLIGMQRGGVLSTPWEGIDCAAFFDENEAFLFVKGCWRLFDRLGGWGGKE